MPGETEGEAPPFPFRVWRSPDPLVPAPLQQSPLLGHPAPFVHPWLPEALRVKPNLRSRPLSEPGTQHLLSPGPLPPGPHCTEVPATCQRARVARPGVALPGLCRVAAVNGSLLPAPLPWPHFPPGLTADSSSSLAHVRVTLTHVQARPAPGSPSQRWPGWAMLDPSASPGRLP